MAGWFEYLILFGSWVPTVICFAISSGNPWLANAARFCAAYIVALPIMSLLYGVMATSTDYRESKFHRDPGRLRDMAVFAALALVVAVVNAAPAVFLFGTNWAYFLLAALLIQVHVVFAVQIRNRCKAASGQTPPEVNLPESGG